AVRLWPRRGGGAPGGGGSPAPARGGGAEGGGRMRGSVGWTAGWGVGASAATAAPTPAPTTLDDLAWMAGAWGGEQQGIHMEEHWTGPSGGLMVGMHRDVSASGKSSFEFLRIEARADGVVYVASPGGRPRTDFRLVESGSRRAVFANPAHDFPQRILYWLGDDGRLHARVEGAPTATERAEEWAWEKLTPR